MLAGVIRKSEKLAEVLLTTRKRTGGDTVFIPNWVPFAAQFSVQLGHM